MIFDYFTNPWHILLMAANLILWTYTYIYIKKVRKEYGSLINIIKHTTIGGFTVKPQDTSINVVITGQTGAGKTTLIRGLERILTLYGYVPRNATYVSDKKTLGINSYVISKPSKKTKNFTHLGKSIVFLDLSGELHSIVGKYWRTQENTTTKKREGNNSGSIIEDLKTPVKFNYEQVKLIKNADIIIHVIHYHTDPNLIKRQFEDYGSAIKRALGINENTDIIRTGKILLVVVTHLDTVNKVIEDSFVKRQINRLLPYPRKLFRHFRIIPTNPKELIWEYENNMRRDVKTLAKVYHYDEIVDAIFKALDEKENTHRAVNGASLSKITYKHIGGVIR